MSDPDKIERGHVLFFIERGTTSYGFIQPQWSSGDRTLNVWFGMLAMQGRTFRQGEEVTFTYTHSNKLHSCPAAYRVWPIGEIANDDTQIKTSAEDLSEDEHPQSRHVACEQG